MKRLIAQPSFNLTVWSLISANCLHPAIASSPPLDDLSSPFIQTESSSLPTLESSSQLTFPDGQRILQVADLAQSETSENDVIRIIVEEKKEEEKVEPASTPVYTIEAEEIRQQEADSVAEILRTSPGFAVNDAGFGADIHTGTYYRGASINQSVFLLNGRPIGSNINTYHGSTDLNSIPTGAIEKVELSSGTSATLYGSEAFGGVVNIVTKQGEDTPTRFNGLVQFGSYDHSNVQGQLSGSVGDVNYIFNYQNFEAENNYRVPIGAANRGPDGRLFNGDTAVTNYYGKVGFDLNDRNSLSLDVSKVSSRRGLLYFGFPLQRDRLDHDLLNAGLSWQAKLGEGDDSTLNTTVSFNQDYFSTYGPTQQTRYRTGSLDSRTFNARVDHDWQTGANHNLRWGLDLQNSLLTGEVESNVPQLVALNGTEDRDRLHTALFALNTWKLNQDLQVELGLRQNFNSEFGSYLNPSVGGRWEVSPTVAMRGSWVSVQRNPGLDQLYVFDTVHNWLPNPNLDPETGSSWTAGVDLQLASNLNAQMTYFGSRLDNRLGIQAGRWENIGLVNTNGLEAALRWQITPQWSSFVNYTYTDAEIQTGPERGLQLGLIPYSVGQLGIGYESAGWQVNLYANYFSGARRALFNTPGDSSEDFSPDWLRLDLGLRVPITRNLGFTAFLENLTDQTYERANRIYQPGLTVRVGLQSY
ncbi:TonB-dependent siderophore receptor [Geitlerinema sp. PCC 7407]|uniref:TonB-dependent receptor plug domain-containing protein n=1 Tax=Geitlerinema sp. PCC 7407 TaxID=1173025 RepID=UPI00029FA5F0|nr:TonB-dependent receptor [Geitlerinema sp. PCC 7407]AFY65740.1 TonB-dependent receptor plug [Geitlerinema sp. PCC 7407]